MVASLQRAMPLLRMANTCGRFILFVSSYVPLWVIFALVNWRARPSFAVVFVVVAVVSLAGAATYLHLAKTLAGIDMPVGMIRRKDADTASYIASYIVPFASAPLDKPEQIAAFAVFMIVLCVIYVNSAMIQVNPLLTFIGYKLYEIGDANGDSYFLISKRRNLRRGDTVQVIDLANNIFLEKRS